MTGLLVSVRDVTEAAGVLSAGVDLVDVKEPAAGSLGAAAPGVWKQVVDQVAGSTLISLALGAGIYGLVFLALENATGLNAVLQVAQSVIVFLLMGSFMVFVQHKYEEIEHKYEEIEQDNQTGEAWRGAE